MRVLFCALTFFLIFPILSNANVKSTHFNKIKLQENESLTGFIIAAGKKTLIKLDHSVLLNIVVDDPQLQPFVTTLSSGDMITGSGHKDLSKKEAHFQSIEFVGLRSLLGLWRSKDGLIFDFSSFSDLKIYPENKSDRLEIPPKQEEAFTYSLSPDESNCWALYLTNAKGTQIYKFKKNHNKVKITNFNEESQSSSAIFELYKIENL